MIDCLEKTTLLSSSSVYILYKQKGKALLYTAVTLSIYETKRKAYIKYKNTLFFPGTCFLVP